MSSIFAAHQVFGQSKPADGYQLKQILFLNLVMNGNANNEVRILGNPNCGPGAMAVDKDENIYITDPGNHRIQVFSIKGNLIRSIPTDSSLSALEVNENGDIYTAYQGNNYRDKVLRIKNDGEVIKTDQDWGIIYNDTLWDYKGNQIFNFEKNPSISSKFNEPLFSKKDVTLTTDENGYRVINIRTEKINRIAKKYGKGTKSDLIKISPDDDPRMTLSYKVLGFDDDGNVYLLEGYYPPHYLDSNANLNLIEERIQIYSIEGALVSEIPLDIDACYCRSGVNEKFFSVDKKGDIFQLLTTQTKVCIYKWSRN
jgi:hypothetical protein